MGLLFRLLNASPKIARAFRDFMFGIVAWASVFVGEANLEAFQKWLWGTLNEVLARVFPSVKRLD